MPYGLKEIELAKLSKVFASNEHIKRVILYGSRAKGNYKLFSDVDITLEGPELTLTDLNHLSLAIDDLLLPYQFDISIFHTLKNEALIDHIRRMGITIYEKKSEWKEYKLGEIASFVKEKISVQEIGLEDYISTENMLADKGGITTASNKPNEGTITRFFPNTILISNIRPYFKKIWFSDRYGGCSNDVLCFEPTKKLVNDKYLFFLLSQDVFFDYVMLGSKGCKMPRGDKSHIMNWEISIPPLPTQRRIAAILSSLDDKIELLHRENATLEQMAETLFRQWFVVEAKEEWEEGKLGDEFAFTMGQSPNGDSFNEEGIGIPMYQGNADFGFRFPTRRVYTTQPTRFAEVNDTLISVRAPVGAQNMAIEKCCIGRGVATFRYKNNPSYYSYTYYKLKSLLEEIKQFNDNGTVFGSISKSDFENLDIVIPDENTIMSFQQQVKPIDDKIINNNNEIRTLIQTRDGLLPRLMGGEVKI